MKRFLLAILALFCVSSVIAIAAEKEKTHIRAKLFGIEEIPATIISDGTGLFTATVNDDSTITYTLSWKNLSAPAVQAHIHIGAIKTAGGIPLFMCGPATTPAKQTCPNDPTNNSGSVSGTLTAADVVGGAAAQGVPVGDITPIIRAIATGVTYVNIHSATHLGGEIRGQIRSQADEDDELPGAR